MSSINKNKHLSSQERLMIEMGINNGSTKKAIAITLGKDETTIAKEIRKHRKQTYKCQFPLECINYTKCRHGRICKLDCPDYKVFICKRRDRTPGACNGCSSYSKCRFNKYRYTASDADHEYRMDLKETRVGFNTTLEEVKRIGNILKPLIDKGQSISQILMTHKEIDVSIKTIYSYIDSGLFKEVGIDIANIKLRRKVSRKARAKKNNLKKREDRSYLIGRTYNDYLNFLKENPDSTVVQMDTVYNDVTNGPFIQTFKFLKYGFLFGLYHTSKDSEAMNEGLEYFIDIIGQDIFIQEVNILLTDRGGEFQKIREVESKDELSLTTTFYCDPMCSNQKGSLENKHIELRYILPKECNLYDLGLTSQAALNEVLSHINSSPRKKLNDKSPIELIEFLNPNLYDKLINFGIKKINRDDVTLKPYLLKKFRIK